MKQTALRTVIAVLTLAVLCGYALAEPAQAVDFPDYMEAFSSPVDPAVTETEIFLGGEADTLQVPESRRQVMAGEELPFEIIGTTLVGFSGAIDGDIVIPDGVLHIAPGVFKGCVNLRSVAFPAGLQTIGAEAFRGCKKLCAADLPDSVTQVGEYAFAGCSSLTGLHLSTGLSAISASAFRGCALETVVIPNGVTGIGEYAFGGLFRIDRRCAACGTDRNRCRCIHELHASEGYPFSERSANHR